MNCPYCGYPKLSKIKVWEDKDEVTWRRYGCLSCGRKFNSSGKKRISARGPASKLSKYATR
jgi:transposase-like protein